MTQEEKKRLREENEQFMRERGINPETALDREFLLRMRAKIMKAIEEKAAKSAHEDQKESRVP